MNRQFFNNVTFFRNNVIAYFQDYSTLRAKSYANVTLVNKKKNYNCDFCDFVTNLFGNLKIHVRSNHLEPERPVAAAPVLHVSFSNPRARSDESILNSSALETRYQIPYFVCKKNAIIGVNLKDYVFCGRPSMAFFYTRSQRKRKQIIKWFLALSTCPRCLQSQAKPLARELLFYLTALLGCFAPLTHKKVFIHFNLYIILLLCKQTNSAFESPLIKN